MGLVRACKAFARLETYRGSENELRVFYECLDEHLADVVVAAVHLLKPLTGVQNNYIEALALAAALHDVGKALHNIFYRSLVERILAKELEGRLSFRYHEIMSAAILGAYYWDLGGLEQETASIALRAIAMHHQGLRGVSAHVYSEGLAQLSSMYSRLPESYREDLHEMISDVIEGVANRLSENNQMKSVVSALKNIANAVSSLELRLDTALDEASTLFPTWIKVRKELATRSRIITGLLMLADSAVARAKAPYGSSEASKYSAEALWLYRAYVSHQLQRSKQSRAHKF